VERSHASRQAEGVHFPLKALRSTGGGRSSARVPPIRFEGLAFRTSGKDRKTAAERPPEE
jgi:hypothetical protein